MPLDKKTLISEIECSRTFLLNSMATMTEEDSAFAPVEGMMTTAQQVAHIAHTVDWFVEGASREEGFDTDFAAHAKIIMTVTSLKEALAWIDRAFAAAVKYVEETDAAWLESPLPPGPIMGGAPRYTSLGSIVDHTAHHRGALTVYARLRGQVPNMPYMSPEETAAFMQ